MKLWKFNLLRNLFIRSSESFKMFARQVLRRPTLGFGKINFGRGRVPQFREQPRSFSSSSAKPISNPTATAKVVETEAAEEFPHLEFVICGIAGLGVAYELSPIAVDKIKSTLSSGSKFLSLSFTQFSQNSANCVTQEDKDKYRENYFAWSKVERSEWRHRESCIIGGLVSFAIGGALCVGSVRSWAKSTSLIPSLENRLLLTSGLCSASYGMAHNWGALMKRSHNLEQAIDETDFWGNYFNQPVEKPEPPVAAAIAAPVPDSAATVITVKI